MRIKIILLIICSSVVNLAFSQDFIQCSEGKPISINKPDVLKIFLSDSTGTYVARRENYPDLAIDLIGNDLSVIKSGLITPPKIDGRAFFYGLTALKDKMYVLWLTQNSEENSLNLYLNEFDKTRFKMTETFTLVSTLSFKDEKSYKNGKWNWSVFKFCTSHNGEYLLVFNFNECYDFNKINATKFSIFNADSKEIASDEIRSWFKSSSFYVKHSSIDDNGSAFFILGQDTTSQALKLYVEKEIQTKPFHLLYFTSGESFHLPLTLENKYIVDVDIAGIKNEKIILAGIFRGKNISDQSGSFFISVNSKTTQILETKLYGFENNFSSTLYFHVYRDLPLDHKKLVDSIKCLPIINKVFLQPNGDVYLVTEQVLCIEALVVVGSSLETITSYMNLNIYIFQFDFSGEQKWSKDVRREEPLFGLHPSNQLKYGKMSSFLIGNRVLVFFNEPLTDFPVVHEITSDGTIKKSYLSNKNNEKITSQSMKFSYFLSALMYVKNDKAFVGFEGQKNYYFEQITFVD